MKLAQSSVEFHSRGVQSKTDYRVAQTAKVMDMFSNMLYKNKIRAVIRELSTNAWDAHIMAGTTDKVPSLHLPSKSDPEFRLRDFGTGMSKTDLESMYQTYGESNKNHSNDFNGCMGIGSKSPFAYANSFTTTSHYNGMKYVYVNAKDRDGMPKIQLMLEESTNEVNGLEISFAVDRSDISKFQDEAQDVLRRFPKMFKVTGGDSNFKPVQDEYVLERGDWKIRKYDYYNHTSYAVMGNVAYPIDNDKFDYNDDDMSEEDKTAWYQHYSRKVGDKKTKRFYTDILNLGMEIHFELGEIEMDISREGLQYTKQTVDAIRNKLDEISNSIADEFSQAIQGADCVWEAAIKLDEVMNGDLRSLRQLIDIDDIKYNGKEVPRFFKVDNLNHSELVYFKKDRYAKTPKRQDIIDKIYVDGGTVFMIADKKVGNYVAAERFMNNNVKDNGEFKYRNLYLIKPEDKSDKAIKEFKKVVGCLDKHIVYASDVPVPPVSKRNVCTEKVFKFTATGTGKYSARYGKYYWDNTNIDFNDGGYYVEINNWNTSRPNSSDYTFSASSLRELVDLFSNKLGIKVPDFYGVKTAAIKKYNDSDDWTNFFDWAMEKIAEYVDNSGIKNQILHIENHDSWSEAAFYETFCKLVVPTQKKPSICKIMLDKIETVNKMVSKWSEKAIKVRRAYRLLDMDFDMSKAKTKVDDWKDLANQVKTSYPFIELVARWDMGHAEKKSAIIKTVELIDSCK